MTLDQTTTGESDSATGEARAKLDASWNALLAALDGIPESHLDRPGVCGEWSIRTLFGHIAFWDRYSLNRARNALAGNPPLEIEADPLNAADVRTHGGRTAGEHREEMLAAHAAMLAFVDGVDSAWPLFTEMLDQMSVDTNQHYDEHAAHIRAWRQQAGV